MPPRSTQVRHTTSVLALGLALAGSLSASVATASASQDPLEPAPAPVFRAEGSAVLTGRYIVVMDRGASRSDSAAVQEQATVRGGEVSATYGAALVGFAAELPPQALDAVRRNPRVQYVEEDATVRASATQSGAPWGLDRVDQRLLPLNRSYSYDRGGAGVTAYVVDTGIRKGHQQFGSRVAGGFSAVNDGRGTGDCNGHGTHVAGTIGSRTYGVAKSVTLRPVRVLNCVGAGTVGKIVDGIDWVTGHHLGTDPAVANMSLGGPISRAIDDAVQFSIADGVTYVAAAGNDGANACDYSPARVSGVVTVGSTTKTDARSGFSNTGSCLDLFAPGSGITSTWHTSNTATRTISGTSMAAPHVAGVAALLLQQGPAQAPEAVADALLLAATTGVVTGRGNGSPNRLLHSFGAPLSPVSGDLIVDGGFEQGAAAWSSSAGVVSNDPDVPAHHGVWKAYLGGYGSVRTDTLEQTVTLPPGPTSLSFFLRIDTEEIGGVYDELDVEVVVNGTAHPLRTFSNADETTGYVRRTMDLGAYSGQTVTLRWTATEDSTAATRFLVDDVVVTAG